MPRYASHIVPPTPKAMSHYERMAWKLWRRGYPVRVAAEKAGITPNTLRLLLGLPRADRADNPPKSHFIEACP